MIIRSLQPGDIEYLRKIHQESWDSEFPFPDFITNCLACFAIEDDNGTLVSAGGLHLITEAVFITDKAKSVRKRKEALEELYRATMFAARYRGYDQIHAFVQQKSFAAHLQSYGFTEPKGISLVKNL